MLRRGGQFAFCQIKAGHNMGPDSGSTSSSTRPPSGDTGGLAVSRRIAAATLAALLVVGVNIASYAEANERTAVRVVSLMLADMGELYRTALTREHIADGLEDIFSEYADMEVISRSVVGVPWRRISDEKRIDFIDVFKRYLAEKYARHLPMSLKGEFEIIKVLELKKDQYSVESSVSIAGSRPYQLRWLVRRSGGNSRIVNMVTSDFNLLNLERTVIRSLLQQRKGNLDQLIAYLPTRYQ